MWGRRDFSEEIELPGEGERAVASIHCVPGSGLGLGVPNLLLGADISN